MSPKEYSREEATINAGIAAAARVIEARTMQLKKECAGVPVDSIRAEVRRGGFNDHHAALSVIADWRRLAEQGKANAA